jgi:hypothetical protein
MSSDKEPADVAMEFLVDDLASPPQEAPPPLPTTFNTAQDLLNWVLSDPDRNPFQRSNESSALRALERILNMPLAAIPADEQYLLNICYKAVRAEKSLKKRRRGEIITLLNRVLKRASIIKVGCRRSGKTSVTWNKVLKSLRSRNDEYGLSPFAKFCSEKGIEPEKVTSDIWAAFVDETLNHSGCKKPRETVRRVIAANNHARTKSSDWPILELPKLVNPRLVSSPKTDFPDPFWEDIKKYTVQSGVPPKNIFDPIATKQLSPDTLQRYGEVKNKQPLRFGLSQPTIALLQFYIKKCRPLLMTKETSLLFPFTIESKRRRRWPIWSAERSASGSTLMLTCTCSDISARCSTSLNIPETSGCRR